MNGMISRFKNKELAHGARQSVPGSHRLRRTGFIIDNYYIMTYFNDFSKHSYGICKDQSKNSNCQSHDCFIQALNSTFTEIWKTSETFTWNY